MTIQWHYQSRPDCGILSLSGYLGSQATTRFTGAIGWALARGTGPVIVDISGLEGWSEPGRDAVVLAARRLAAHDRALELAGLPHDHIALNPRPDDPNIRQHPDLGAALSAQAATEPQAVR